MDFSRKLKELLREESQADAARKLGYTQSRVSQVARGERPSREFVERLVEVYGLPREEWLGVAGYGPQAAAEETDEQYDRIAEAVERRFRQTGLIVNEETKQRENVQEYLDKRLDELEQEHPGLKIDLLAFRRGLRAMTLEEADSLVDDLRKQIEEGSI